MKNRREFLRHLTLVSSGLMTGSVFRGARASDLASASASSRKLVVVELEGGCDGLNTVIPYRDDHYCKARPTLALAEKQGILKLNDDVGLHPSMVGLPNTTAVRPTEAVRFRQTGSRNPGNDIIPGSLTAFVTR